MDIIVSYKIDWWQRGKRGDAHFDKELYERFLKAKQLKTEQQNERQTNSIKA